jgi:hypothetical protein
LERKGFEYTFVSSYGEGIAELSRNEGGRCPFTQLWLFSSPGYGELPDEPQTDKDVNKIKPFLQAVNDFWEAGGGLFLFCDNDPYTFEANYLLANCLTFVHDGTSGKTKVRFGGLPCTTPSGATFNGWTGKNHITVGTTEASGVKTFFPRADLSSPGVSVCRKSLRRGLVRFFEGNTISYAVDSSGTPITSESDLWPFTAFAWTSENVHPPRPFILFHDPKITSPDLDCRGPVVIHGGFTSAFYEFDGDDSGGTARLVISISGWLTRFEERICAARKTGRLATTVRALTGNYTVREEFKGFIQRQGVIRHSILCLDVSGSMRSGYPKLARGANRYIAIQASRAGKSSIVQFNSSASILYERETRAIGEAEGYTGGGTDFSAPLNHAIAIVNRSRADIPQYECRIVFFTDGGAGVPTSELKQLKDLGIRMDVIGCGSVDESRLRELVLGGGELKLIADIDQVADALCAIAATH